MTGRERLRRIVVRRAPGKESRGVLAARGIRAEAALGRSGIARHKREGDGRTPTGRFRLVAVYYRPDRVDRPRTTLPVAAIRPDLGWCDDPADRRYNRPVRLPYPAHHERLSRNDRLYDIVVVLDFNLVRPHAGAGSAIFLHIAIRSWLRPKSASRSTNRTCDGCWHAPGHTRSSTSGSC
ncbi:MAG: L,D-transpeptidase family protein [Bauldia sp.]